MRPFVDKLFHKNVLLLSSSSSSPSCVSTKSSLLDDINKLVCNSDVQIIYQIFYYLMLIVSSELCAVMLFFKLQREIFKKDEFPFNVDTRLKLNLHKTFRRRLERILNVLCTFNLSLVSTELVSNLV